MLFPVPFVVSETLLKWMGGKNFCTRILRAIINKQFYALISPSFVKWNCEKSSWFKRKAVISDFRAFFATGASPFTDSKSNMTS